MKRILLLAGLLHCAAASAGLPFPPLPDWESADADRVSTGGALVDLDRDGWLDLVVSNGNDILRQPLVVYYNQGDGTFPDSPDWWSASFQYHAHLAVGDVNQDGWTDVAVSLLLGPAGWSDPGWVALYLNDGAGGLPLTPSWVSLETFNSFGLAFGDADGDGDLDLAVAVGEPYWNDPGQSLVFTNRDGLLVDPPAWRSGDVEHNMAVTWGDADDDGDLDLAFSGTGAPHRIYFNVAGVLQTSSGWRSSQRPVFAFRPFIGDLDRDGRMDFAVPENNQLDLGTDGRFQVHYGTPTGLQRDPGWSSDFSGYGSETVIGDADGDGWPELLGGSWGGNNVYSDAVRLYPNRYVRALETGPSWVSATGSVIERLLLGDVDNDGLRRTREKLVVLGDRQVFYLERIPFREIVRLVADGVELGPTDYCFDREAGWIALGAAPLASLEVEYVYSVRQDLVVLNWDRTQGNFLFYAREPPHLLAVKGPTQTELRLQWTEGTPLFDVLESRHPGFGPGLELMAEGLDTPEWLDAPGTLSQGGLRFYRVH